MAEDQQDVLPPNVLDLNRDPEGNMIYESPYELVVLLRNARKSVDDLRLRLQNRMNHCDHAAVPCARCETDERVMRESLHV